MAVIDGETAHWLGWALGTAGCGLFALRQWASSWQEERYEIFNTDQGADSLPCACSHMLDKGIRVDMDGRQAGAGQ
ncbi:MAG: hypothetical protein U1F68_01940 [Gammaproteobacteria bacterium]